MYALLVNYFPQMALERLRGVLKDHKIKNFAE